MHPKPNRINRVKVFPVLYGCIQKIPAPQNTEPGFPVYERLKCLSEGDTQPESCIT